MDFKKEDICYFVENNRIIREGKVVSVRGSMVQIKYGDHAGMRLNKKRIFHTEEEAKQSIPKQIRSPHLNEQEFS